MRVLVTGGSGYVGSHAVRELDAAGHGVVIYDNLSTGHRRFSEGYEFIEADIADETRLANALHGIEAVMHFAASAYVGESVTNPRKYFRNNVESALKLLDAVLASSVRFFIFSSTCATYGIPQTVPITESNSQAPINPYGATKLFFEHALAAYAVSHGLRSVSLRYFNAAGAHAGGSIGELHNPETHLIPRILEVALGRAEHVNIFGTDYATPDGTCIRDYIHVSDLARAHLLALEALAPGSSSPLIYNLGNGQGFSVREVVEVARKVTGHPVPVIESPRRAGDPAVLIASSEKIRRDLGWQPRFPDLKTIVESAWQWHRTHPDGYLT